MSSFCDGIELKVTGFDKTEEEVRARGFELPEISYITCFEQYYPQTCFRGMKKKYLLIMEKQQLNL